MSDIVDQPPPIPNDRPAIVDLVMADMVERKRIGIERYGVPLQAGNGRDALVDLYQELLDAVMYIRQVIAERDAAAPDWSGHDAALAEVIRRHAADLQVDVELRQAIIRRDGGGCVARLANQRSWPQLQGLPDPGPCRNAAGEERSPFDQYNLTIDEIKMDAPGEPGSHFRAGKRAGYSLGTCVTACVGHHVFGRGSGAQWTTKAVVRAALRLYIPEANRRAGLIIPP